MSLKVVRIMADLVMLISLAMAGDSVARDQPLFAAIFFLLGFLGLEAVKILARMDE